MALELTSAKQAENLARSTDTQKAAMTFKGYANRNRIKKM
jgi:hypothetical protein